MQINKSNGKVTNISARAAVEVATTPTTNNKLRSNWLHLLIWMVLLLALLPRLLDFGVHSWQVLGWQWQIDYDEGLNLSAAWNLSQGHNIYANSTPDRFIAASYPPFYFLLNALLIKVWGVSLLGGRLLSFSAALLIGCLIGLNVRSVARRLGSGRLDASGAGILAGLAWFCLPPTYIWSTLYKQDLTAIAIALLGLTLVYRWQDSPRLYWAAPILALSFFTKQNELMAVGVGGLYIVWREVWRGDVGRLRPNWRRAVLFGVALAACVLIPFGLLNLLTKNGYYNHIIGYQLVPWNFGDMVRRLGKVVADNIVWLVLAGLYLLLELVGLIKRWRQKHKWLERVLLIRPGLFPLYLTVASFSLFTIGAYQGNYNLTLDLFPPLLICAGAALAWTLTFNLKPEYGQNFWRVGGFYKAGGLLLLILVLGGLGWQVFNFGDPGSYFSLGSMPGTDRRNLMERLALEVHNAPGDFISDDVYIVLSQGRGLPYDNLYHIRLQTADNKWDDSLLLQDLRNRRFGLVLLEHNAQRWTDQAWQVLNQNYELVFPDGIDLWRPRSRPLVPQYATQCSLTDGADQLSLQGYSLGVGAKTLRPGDGLTVTTYWNTAKPVANSYTLFVHLLDNKGQLVAQRDAPPDIATPDHNFALVPTSGWPLNMPLQVDQSLPLPANLAPGTYRLIVGAYRTEANGLISMQPACANAVGSSIQLGQVDIK